MEFLVQSSSQEEAELYSILRGRVITLHVCFTRSCAAGLSPFMVVLRLRRSKKEERERDGVRREFGPIAEEAVEAEDEVLLVGGDGGAEVVHPSEAAALTAAEKPRALRQRPPPPLPFFPDELGQHLVLLFIPTSVQHGVGTPFCSKDDDEDPGPKPDDGFLISISLFALSPSLSLLFL